MINTILEYCNQMLLCVGIVFILAGSVMYIFPPKKINGLYGYRTQTSMQSQQKWNFAQTYSAKIMMLTGLIFTLIAPSKGLFKTNDSIDLAIGMFCMIVGSILMIVVVEKALRKIK
ncbi:SdpI/YhfL protein family protein [Paenimyroides ummariense]|uniref:SdpI/YhfL protein family protein n=1 Tax=Paenimyroides ummariense TaxID=913024 RepID=A0A1I5EVD5_9FLAO|nr:SdpI family protein [Paenimyroides ummariense]SFO15488.1 SdpI/YhfL protein family protein [Paenimyroides ummariense]